MLLNDLDLLQLHQVVSFADHAEVNLLGEVLSKVLLDHHRELELLQTLPFHLGEEHAHVALDVDYHYLEFHLHHKLASQVATVATLDYL